MKKKMADQWPTKFVYCRHRTPKELKKKVYPHQVDEALSFPNDEADIKDIKKWVYAKEHKASF